MIERFQAQDAESRTGRRTKVAAAAAAAGAIVASLTACAATSATTTAKHSNAPEAIRIMHLDCSIPDPLTTASRLAWREITYTDRQHKTWEAVVGNRGKVALYVDAQLDGNVMYYATSPEPFPINGPSTMEAAGPGDIVYDLKTSTGDTGIEIIASKFDSRGNRLNSITAACGDPATIPQSEAQVLVSNMP